MYSTLINVLICIVIIIGGLAIYAKADTLSEVIKKFYSQYPLIKYAGDEQLSNRPIFLKAFGVIFVLLGLIAFCVEII